MLRYSSGTELRSPVALFRLAAYPALFDNRQSLHCLILKERDCDLLSVSADAMCAFLKTVGVVSDHPAGSFDDALRRTVILCKLDHHSFRKIFLKIQHDLRLCTAKTIDGLVIIADDKQIVSRPCQKFDRLILDRIDILKFIDQNIAETFLPSLQISGLAFNSS